MEACNPLDFFGLQAKVEDLQILPHMLGIRRAREWEHLHIECEPEHNLANGPLVPLGDPFKGKIHEVGKSLWAAIMDAFPNLDNTVKNQVFDDATNTVTCRVVIFGTQEKEFAGIPSKKKNFDSEHIFIFRFNDAGKVSDLKISWDHEGFVGQLTRG